MTIAETIEALNLDPASDRDELVALLQERLAAQSEALAAPLWSGASTQVVVILRDSQRQEIALCEAALAELGAPFIEEE